MAGVVEKGEVVAEMVEMVVVVEMAEMVVEMAETVAAVEMVETVVAAVGVADTVSEPKLSPSGFLRDLSTPRTPSVRWKTVNDVISLNISKYILFLFAIFKYYSIQ